MPHFCNCYVYSSISIRRFHMMKDDKNYKYLPTLHIEKFYFINVKSVLIRMSYTQKKVTFGCFLVLFKQKICSHIRTIDHTIICFEQECIHCDTPLYLTYLRFNFYERRTTTVWISFNKLNRNRKKIIEC